MDPEAMNGLIWNVHVLSVHVLGMLLSNAVGLYS
jgi:hypothetical protein